MLKRSGDWRPGDPRAPKVPKTGPTTGADTAAGPNDTQSYDSDGDDPSFATTAALEVWLPLAEDPSTSEVDRLEHIEQCMALLTPTGKDGALALDEPHWRLFGAITLLHRPDTAARRFARKFLPERDAAMSADECVRRASTVGALRAALAAIEQHATPHALRAVVGKVLYVNGSTRPSLLLSRELLGIAFLGRERLVKAVFEACLDCLDRQGALSKLSCLASLAVMVHLAGGDERDLDRAALALGDGDEGLPLSYLSLQLCCTLLLALSVPRTDDLSALATLLKDIDQSLACLRSPGIVPELVTAIAQWASDVMHSIRADLPPPVDS